MDELLQLLKYGLASALGLGADFGLLVLLVEWGQWSPVAASAVGFLLGCLVVFIVSRSWVFKQQKHESLTYSFVLFWAIGVLGLLLNQGIMYAGVALVGLHYALTKACSAGVVFCFNYLLRSRLVFSPEVV